MNDSKTEQKCYIKGLNCSEENARDNMMAVKKRYGKVDGILAFHGYQSFAPGEVTPQLAHDIGIELASRMWADRFQVIVATHLDKEHIHNHFVINSVSFVDGKKYNSCKESYRLLRKTSDDICREYGLSVIEKPKSSERVPYHIHEAEENNQLTKNNFMKNDIDECILLSISEQDFFSHMQRRGYSFAKQTNVNVNNRLICYDILDLGSQLMPIGMLVVLDSILNRITANRAAGRETYIFIDEIYLLFQHEYSANFLFTLWKRVRKYGAFATGITQNVSDLLQSHTARTMLANSEFITMLNQGGTDKEDLANLLQISETQMTHITNVEAGHGLVKVGSALVPFERKFPKDTELYKLMTTKLGE